MATATEKEKAMELGPPELQGFERIQEWEAGERR